MHPLECKVCLEKKKRERDREIYELLTITSAVEKKTIVTLAGAIREVVGRGEVG